MGDLVVVAPVIPTRETALREHLHRLDGGPLAELPYETHFGRFVILPVDGPQLFFSSRFDVDVERYIAALAEAPGAGTIWSFCESPRDLRDPAHLRRYLSRHRVKSPYLLSLWPDASVSEVNDALALQGRFSRFMLEAASLEPAVLAHAFRERFPR